MYPGGIPCVSQFVPWGHALCAPAGEVGCTLGAYPVCPSWRGGVGRVHSQKRQSVWACTGYDQRTRPRPPVASDVVGGATGVCVCCSSLCCCQQARSIYACDQPSELKGLTSPCLQPRSEVASLGACRTCKSSTAIRNKTILFLS